MSAMRIAPEAESTESTDVAALAGLLHRFGNQHFAFARTSFDELREIFRVVDPEPGALFCDAGAGYGDVVFYAACVSACRLRAIELVPDRCTAMRRTRRRLGLTAKHVAIVQGDASSFDYDDVAYLFLNNPFFPNVAARFVATLSASANPDLTVIAINNIVDALRADKGFAEIETGAAIPAYRFGVFRRNRK